MALYEIEFLPIDEVAEELGKDRKVLIEWGRKGAFPIYAFIEYITTLPGEYAVNSDFPRGKGPPAGMPPPSIFTEIYAKILPVDLPSVYGPQQKYDFFEVKSFEIYGERSTFCPALFMNGSWPGAPSSLEIYSNQLMIHVDDVAMIKAGLQQEQNQKQPVTKKTLAELAEIVKKLAPLEKDQDVIAARLRDEHHAEYWKIAKVLKLKTKRQDESKLENPTKNTPAQRERAAMEKAGERAVEVGRKILKLRIEVK